MKEVLKNLIKDTLTKTEAPPELKDLISNAEEWKSLPEVIMKMIDTAALDMTAQHLKAGAEAGREYAFEKVDETYTNIIELINSSADSKNFEELKFAKKIVKDLEILQNDARRIYHNYKKHKKTKNEIQNN